MKIKEIARAHEAMMGRGMMLGEVVGKIVGPTAPINEKIPIIDTIVDPIEMHVHGYGASLFDCIIDYTSGTSIVSLDGCWRLRVAHSSFKDEP